MLLQYLECLHSKSKRVIIEAIVISNILNILDKIYLAIENSKYICYPLL